MNGAIGAATFDILFCFAMAQNIYNFYCSFFHPLFAQEMVISNVMDVVYLVSFDKKDLKMR